MIAIFGRGLVGGGVLRELMANWQRVSITNAALDWRQPLSQSGQLEQIERLVGRRAGIVKSEAAAVSMSVLWAAGRAGFSATEDEAVCELRSFESVVAMAERLAQVLPQAEVAFFMISSAGGLFEGQRSVDEQSEPQPLRPYGKLKARQEERLLAASAGLRKRIFRVSSVYGCIDPGHRMGLIPKLLHDGVRRQVSTIVGAPSTLRDFVWLGDMSRYIVQDLLHPNKPSPGVITYLCSGRPTSLGEVLRLAERVLGRRPYVQFSMDGANTADITFSPRLLPAAWSRTDLYANMLSVYRHAMTHGVRSHP